jgi:sortase A
MGNLLNKDGKKSSKKKVIRIFGIVLFILGLFIITYIFFPFFSWQIYFAESFATQDIKAPIPKSTIVTNNTIGSLISEAGNSLTGIDYTNAQNWFPNYRYQKGDIPKILSYTISIPKINVKNAVVSTADTDLAKHLVNYYGTAIPSEKGNAVIFGHSTLPQLYNSKDYKTVFSNLYKLAPGDKILVNSAGVNYTYKVESVTVVDPDNTTILEQNFDDSFITLVTCTPPGTIWKRLAVKGRIENL